MATLSTTLSKAPPNRSTYAGPTGVPKRDNPYMRLGANVGQSPSGGGSQGLFSALMQQQQFQRPTPSTQFTANYNFDPVLSRLSALGEMSIANARTEAANLKKKALIDAGIGGDFGREVGADENTIAAAQGNTMSTQALLQRDFAERQRQLDEALNAQGLFYSGQRIRDMGDLEFGRAQAQTGFLDQLRGLIGGVDQSLLAAEEAEILRQIEAASAASANTFPGTGGTAPPTDPIVPPVDPIAPVGPTAAELGVTSGTYPTVAPGQIPPEDLALALALYGYGPAPRIREF